MDEVGADIWTTTAEVPEQGLVRYVYDRWDGVGCCELATAARERVFTGDPLSYRLLLVGPETSEVTDVVPRWQDLEGSLPEVQVTGTVTDSATGEPLMDVDVTAGGVHVASRFDGAFTIPGLVPGRHRVVARTAKGDHAPSQLELDVSADGINDVNLAMSPTEMTPVEFTVSLSPDTPDNSVPHIGGNISQLGARSRGTNSPFIADGSSMPALERSGNSATITVDLPVGAFVEYFYTLGTDTSAETLGQARRLRTMIVDGSKSARFDRIDHWANEGWPVFNVRVEVPVNTPAGAPVYFVSGPSYPMDKIADHTYVTTIGSMPAGDSIDYRISLGDDLEGLDGSTEADNYGARVLEVPADSGEISLVVSRWKSLPDPTARDSSGGLNVIFRLSTPPGTPPGSSIRIIGDRPALGADGTLMTTGPSNPWMHEANVHFGHDGPLTYRYAIDGSDMTSGEFTINTDYDGQRVADWVTAWIEGDASNQTPPPAPRREWIAGVYPPDFWQPAFLPESNETFSAAIRDNADWVAVSSVWSFGRIQPDPVIESRPLLTWTVLTPIDDIRAQTRVAHDMGLKVLLAPQQNPEVQPDWQDQTTKAGTPEWWNQWIDQARAQWMWNAVLAEEVGAEMLLLPGYVFHVFPPTDFFADPEYAPLFDQAVQDLIGEVRSVYSGKILVSGSQDSYDFPGMADYVGTTTYDLGVPELPAEAEFNDLVADYGRRFAERVDTIHDRWSKPVLFYTIHSPSRPRPGDPTGELYQAAAYEAMFRQIAERPFVIGSFSWAFDMIGASEFTTSGVRGRASESVLAKWYDLLGSVE